MELLTETLRGKSLGCSSAELMAMKMVLMMESDWVELMEMSWAHLKELQSETRMAKQKGLLMVNQKEMQWEHVKVRKLVLRKETELGSCSEKLMDDGSVHSMEMTSAQSMETNWDHLTENLKEMCLVDLLAESMVM